MKYIEELVPGSTFIKNNTIFLLTTDYKKDGSKLAYSIENGFPFWLKPSDIVDACPLFKLDSDNNVIPIHKILPQTENIS